jgi:hypothetical protein
MCDDELMESSRTKMMTKIKRAQKALSQHLREELTVLEAPCRIRNIK